MPTWRRGASPSQRNEAAADSCLRRAAPPGSDPAGSGPDPGGRRGEQAVNRLVVIGLDSLTPQLALEAWLEEMPNLKALSERGLGGRLQSTIPAITVPAWTSMMTSKDPGTLGVY